MMMEHTEHGIPPVEMEDFGGSIDALRIRIRLQAFDETRPPNSLRRLFPPCPALVVLDSVSVMFPQDPLCHRNGAVN